MVITMRKFLFTLLLISSSICLIAQKGETWLGLHSGFGVQTIVQTKKNIPNFSPSSSGARENGLSFSYLFTKNIAVYLEGAVKQHWQEYYSGQNHVSATINTGRYSIGMRMPFMVSPNGFELVVDYGYYYEREYLRFNENYDPTIDNLKPPLINNHGLLAAFGVNFRFSKEQRLVPSIHFKVNMDVGSSNAVKRHSHLAVFGINYRL